MSGEHRDHEDKGRYARQRAGQQRWPSRRRLRGGSHPFATGVQIGAAGWKSAKSPVDSGVSRASIPISIPFGPLRHPARGLDASRCVSAGGAPIPAIRPPSQATGKSASGISQGSAVAHHRASTAAQGISRVRSDVRSRAAAPAPSVRDAPLQGVNRRHRAATWRWEVGSRRVVVEARVPPPAHPLSQPDRHSGAASRLPRLVLEVLEVLIELSRAHPQAAAQQALELLNPCAHPGVVLLGGSPPAALHVQCGARGGELVSRSARP